jgi:hypothetical protein
MAWYSRDGHDSTDAVDEASVGLIAPKQESGIRWLTEPGRSWISKSSLGVVLVLSNLAWVGICLMLWRELDVPLSTAQASSAGLEADFGTSVPRS